jgi:hypothetical protein
MRERRDPWGVALTKFLSPTPIFFQPSETPESRMTLFHQCVEAAELTDLVDGLPDYTEITRAVLECLLENTGSPRTVDEMTRVLGEGAVVAPFVA